MTLAQVRFKGEVHLGDVAPFAQDTNGILSVSHAVYNVLRQQRAAASDLIARPRYNAGRSGVFVSFRCLGDQSLVILSWKNCDLPSRSLLKANSHDVLSIVNFSPVPDGGYNNRSIILIEDHAP